MNVGVASHAIVLLWRPVGYRQPYKRLPHFYEIVLESALQKPIQIVQSAWFPYPTSVTFVAMKIYFIRHAETVDNQANR